MIEILDTDRCSGGITKRDFLYNTQKYNNLYEVFTQYIDVESTDIYSEFEQFKFNGNIFNIPGIVACYKYYSKLKYNFLCTEFGKSILDVFLNIEELEEAHNGYDFKKTEYKIEPIDNLKSGNVILLANNTYPTLWLNYQYHINYTHIAVYIGDNLYLSKFGDSGLYITSLEEMIKIYNIKDIYVLTKQ